MTAILAVLVLLLAAGVWYDARVRRRVCWRCVGLAGVTRAINALRLAMVASAPEMRRAIQATLDFERSWQRIQEQLGDEAWRQARVQIERGALYQVREYPAWPGFQRAPVLPYDYGSPALPPPLPLPDARPLGYNWEDWKKWPGEDPP